MAEESWTREETNKFKNALLLFSPFSLKRFESIAEYVSKPVADVKEHYGELVNDLLEMTRSCRVALSDQLTQTMGQSLYQPGGTVWDKELHEWFLIGLKRFGKDWRRIADLLEYKDTRQVAMYAHNYFHWQKSEKSSMKRPRANNLTIVETNVNVTKRPRANDFTIDVDALVARENLETLALTHVSQPQQEPVVLDIGVHMPRPSTSS